VWSFLPRLLLRWNLVLVLAAARGDVGRLAQRQLPDQKGRHQRDRDDRDAGNENRMQRVREAVADAGFDRGWEVGELGWIENGFCTAGAGRLEPGPDSRRTVCPPGRGHA